MPVDLERTASGGLVFTAKPGRYAILAFSDSGQAQRIVEIAGDSPNPGPGPPPPVPVNFGFEKFVIENSPLIASHGRRYIRAVAANFASAAASIRSGKVLTLESATSHISRLNAATLGTNVTAWNSWLVKIGFAVDHLEDNATITNVSQKAQVFDEIAAGLKKYADQEAIALRAMKQRVQLPQIDMQSCTSGGCLEVVQ